MSDLDNRASNAAFINEACHSLRQPLLALSLNLAALQLQLDNPSALQTASRLRDSADLLASLIEDVMLVARLRFGVGASGRVTCHWPELIDELARQRAAAGALCSVAFHQPAAEMPTGVGFQADRAELLQLLHRAVDLAFLAGSQANPCVVAAPQGLALNLSGGGQGRSDPNLQLRLRLASRLAEALGVGLQMRATPGSPTFIQLTPSIA